MRKSLVVLLSEHKWFLLPFLFFIGFCFYLEAIIPKADLFLIINGFHSGVLDTFFKGTTYIGDGITMIVFGVILCAFSFRNGLLTLIAYAYTSVIAQILKYSFHAPRPIKFFSDLHQPIRTIEGYPIHEWNSFPSGHSVSAFSLAVVIAWLLPRKHKNLAWLILTIAILTAFSRIYLAEHFFQDVVAGAILGVILTFQLIYFLENSKWFYSQKLDKGFINPKLKGQQL